VLDLRSLALMRIAIGAILIADLAIRAPDLAVFYADAGAVPVAFLRGPHYSWGFSFHILDGGTGFQALLFLIAAVAAVALMVGWRTRLAAVVSWLMLLSLQHRNSLLLQGGDQLLVAALFWGLFLPWGRRFSIDALRGRAPVGSNAFLGISGAAWIGQICILYVFAALLKNGSQWRVDGTAIAFVLRAGQYNTAFSDLVLGAPALLKALSFAVLGLEALTPIALLIPWRGGLVRTVTLVLLCGMHLGIAVVLAIGLFPLISVATLLGLFPPGAWALAARLHRGATTVDLAPPPSAPAPAPAPRSRITRAAVAVVCVATFALVLVHNIQTVWAWRVPPALTAILLPLRLNQNWSLFAPQAGQDTWWHVVRGQLASGRAVDLFRGGQDLTFAEPERPSSLYPNQRWLKFMASIWPQYTEPCRQAWLEHLCGAWNDRHAGAERLLGADILFLARPIRLDDVREPPRIVVLSTRTCPGPRDAPVASRAR
jgi:hypothetical protein